jgi:CRISPR-associated protein Cas1
VTEPGARIEKDYHRILVTKDDVILQRVPLARVEEVVLVGRVGATTPAMHALLDAGAGLTMISREGRLRGQLAPPLSRNAPLRQAQYQVEQERGFCLNFARAVVRGKLANSRTMMRRLLRRRHKPLPERLLRRVQDALDGVQIAGSVDELRGIEGAAARAYFGFIQASLRDGVVFEKRARRPPPDPVNALLSLGYTLLGAAMISALEVVGLDPYVGFFHADKYGRPALALDLIEEFRAPVVDSLVLTLFNKRLLPAKDFEPGRRGGVYLTHHGRQVFFREFAERLETRVKHWSGRRFSYRKLLEVQARVVAAVVLGKREHYRSFAWW